MTPLRKRMLEELQLRNLSEATSSTYLQAVARFAKYFGKSPEQLGPDYVRQYLLHLLNDKKDTWSTLQVNRGALKFLYARVLKQSWFDEEIAAPKRRLSLPTILSPEQITRVLDRTSNLKHWTIIATFYATALRCTELRYLKVTDIDGQQMILHVRHGKGSVPRDIPLSHFCWSGCASTIAGASRTIGCSRLNSTPIGRWMIIHSARCAVVQDTEPAFLIRSIRICSAMLAPPTCSMPVPISAPSRFYSATPIFGPPPSISAYPSNGCRLSAAPSMRSPYSRLTAPGKTVGSGDGASAGSRRCLTPTRSGIPGPLGTCAVSPATQGIPRHRRMPYRCPRHTRRAM